METTLEDTEDEMQATKTKIEIQDSQMDVSEIAGEKSQVKLALLDLMKKMVERLRTVSEKVGLRVKMPECLTKYLTVHWENWEAGWNRGKRVNRGWRVKKLGYKMYI